MTHSPTAPSDAALDALVAKARDGICAHPLALGGTGVDLHATVQLLADLADAIALLRDRPPPAPQDEAAPLTVGVRADDLAELLKSATEAAEDLAAEIDRKHGLPDATANPVTARAHARDMQPVIRLRAALNILATWREMGKSW